MHAFSQRDGKVDSNPKQEMVELSDEELEQVYGGRLRGFGFVEMSSDEEPES